MLDLAPQHRQLLTQIFKQYAPSAKLYVFGSRALGNAKPHSDVDVALDTDAPLSALECASLNMALEESDLPMRVDWLVLNQAPAFIHEQVASSQAILISD